MYNEMVYTKGNRKKVNKQSHWILSIFHFEFYNIFSQKTVKASHDFKNIQHSRFILNAMLFPMLKSRGQIYVPD